jgi:HK97 family phage portal protein
MSLLGRAVREVRSFTMFRLSNDFFGDWGTSNTYTGELVSQQTAMTISAVYAAVSFISETIATLPMDLVQKYPDGSRYSRPKPDWMLMPNRITGMDWVNFCQQVLLSLLLDGNAFIGIVRKPGLLEPSQLWVLDPTAIDVTQDKASGSPIYTFNSTLKTIDRANLLHIRGLTMPGQVRGVSSVERARQSLGRIMAAEKFGAKMAVPGVVIIAGKDVDKDQAKDIADRFDRLHKGTDAAFNTAVLGSGSDIKTISLSPEQVQMIETMKYGILDVARWYRIMPYLLDPTVTSTWGSGIAEQNIQTKQYTLNPWAVRFQNALAPLLYDTYYSADYAIKADFRGFLKGDPEKQARYLETKIRCKAATPNDWRALDDENPLPGGDAPLDSVQWQPEVVAP